MRAYLHICEFAGLGWGFTPGSSPEAPPRARFGADFGDRNTPKYPTREACLSAGEYWLKERDGSLSPAGQLPAYELKEWKEEDLAWT